VVQDNSFTVLLLQYMKNEQIFLLHNQTHNNEYDVSLKDPVVFNNVTFLFDVILHIFSWGFIYFISILTLNFIYDYIPTF
jgi:hypothetical protein